MAYHDHRSSLLVQQPHNAHDFFALAEIKTRCRLIQNHHRRRRNNNARQRQQLTRTAIQQERLSIGVKPKELDNLVNTLVCFRRIATLRLKAEHKLIAHRFAANLPIRVLKKEAHAARQLAHTQLRSGHAIDKHLAGNRFQQPVAQAHGR